MPDRYLLPDDNVYANPIHATAASYWHLPPATWEKINSRVTGKGIVIANLDTGYNPRHRLQSKPIAERSFVRGERDAHDRNGHGSHTCGTNAARSPLISPAFEADLIVAKVLDRNGEGSADISEAIHWAVKEGANILSMSLGGSYRDPRTQAALAWANERGVISVAAAGNDGFKPGTNTIGNPAQLRSTICVGAYREDGQIASFSSGGRQIDVAAPGQAIASLGHRHNQIIEMSGTSMACPFMAAVFALVLESMIREGAPVPANVDGWRKFIAANCRDAGAHGVDQRFGHGIPLYLDMIETLANDDLKWT